MLRGGRLKFSLLYSSSINSNKPLVNSLLVLDFFSCNFESQTKKFQTMKKLLLFVMLTGFLAVNAQHTNDVKSDIITIDGWNLSKTTSPPVEYREVITVNRYDSKSDIIPIDGWNLSKRILPIGEHREINTVNRYGGKSGIIPIDGWNLPKTVLPAGEHR